MKEKRKKFSDIPGAVVLGGDYQGLGIVRSLGRKGVPVCVLDDEYSISRFSRYATHSEKVRDLHDEEKAVKSLLDVGMRLDLKGWVLYPTRDELVAALSRHRAQLSEFFRVPTPVWESIKWIWDKRNTCELCNKLDIPIPSTWIPASVEDLDQINNSFPIAVKPAIKEHFFYKTKDKAWRADSREELKELFSRATAVAGAGEIILQDLIPGDGRNQFAYCAFFKDGKAMGKMVTRRTRQHPYEFGRASTFVETVDLPILETLSERFLRAINYYGLVEIEFKLDPRDGEFKLLDVNGRTWGYHSLGPSAGVDFTSMLYGDQVGEIIEPCQGRPGVSWVRLVTDIPTGIVEILKGRLGLRYYLRTLKDFNTEAVFSREDLLPGVVEFALLPYLMVKRGF